MLSNFLTVSWLGLCTVEKTEGLKKGWDNFSVHKCISNGLTRGRLAPELDLEADLNGDRDLSSLFAK